MTNEEWKEHQTNIERERNRDRRMVRQSYYIGFSVMTLIIYLLA